MRATLVGVNRAGAALRRARASVRNGLHCRAIPEGDFSNSSSTRRARQHAPHAADELREAHNIDGSTARESRSASAIRRLTDTKLSGVTEIESMPQPTRNSANSG